MTGITNLAHISTSDHIHVDDPEPQGYLNWIEWAHRQAKAHRTQKRCPKCERYYWPHLGECGRCNGCSQVRTRQKRKAAEEARDE